MSDIERINDIIKYSGLSVRAFSSHIGLRGPQSIYDIQRGKHGISKRLADLIHSKYLNFNYNWIRTGEGEMLKSNEVKLESVSNDDAMTPDERIDMLIRSLSKMTEVHDRDSRSIETMVNLIKDAESDKKGTAPAKQSKSYTADKYEDAG
ncbi:hypothetical protein [Paludibacter sp. 221]|uniref:hypothetical protein n=1 Tax=Paludibacter sp. 221 TaxID=2302939 RepID=UPI0013D1C254|nr:hypothetical protein [Paludibacter sp. 221]